MLQLSPNDLLDFMNEKAALYNRPSFIETDPIQVPHQFDAPGDIEVAAFFTAIMAWGQRKAIIKAAQHLMQVMDHAPYAFVMGASETELKQLNRFVYRTFQGVDVVTFVQGLRHCYQQYGSLESLVNLHRSAAHLHEAIQAWRHIFFSPAHPQRSEKHFADPSRGAAAKRLHLFFRWMVRRDPNGVDFGLWHSIPMSVLSCPLDVHSGRVARQLGLLLRPQNDLKAVVELDAALRRLDPSDPVKYDFALFGLGAFEGF